MLQLSSSLKAQEREGIDKKLFARMGGQHEGASLAVLAECDVDQTVPVCCALQT